MDKPSRPASRRPKSPTRGQGPQEIAEVGLSIVYCPPNDQEVVDIILVHGLQGHPYKTWAKEVRPQPPATWSWSSLVWGGKKRSAGNLETYWPRDLLPQHCPTARVAVFGYDTHVARLPFKGKTNQNSLFSHAKDLLYEVARFRKLRRPIIFVAHSLGGVTVKELLSKCASSEQPDFKDVLQSLVGIVFLGTPHRGSDVAGIGDVIRKTAGMFGMDTNYRILQSLSLKNSDLERNQETFSALWHEYGFSVKTFQEGLPLSLPIWVGGARKVVPDISSCLGDSHERTETLSADHREMCRFSGPGDSNFKKVASEIRRLCETLTQEVESQVNVSTSRHQQQQLDTATETTDSTSLAIPRTQLQPHLQPDPQPSSQTQEVVSLVPEGFELLRYPGMFVREQSIERPLEDTCKWLWAHPDFQRWLSRHDVATHKGLFQITGKPGSGKSTLLRSVYYQLDHELSNQNVLVVGFFFNGRGTNMEYSASGFFRSLLYQILPVLWSRPEFATVRSKAPRLSDFPSQEPPLQALKGLLSSILLDSNLPFRLILVIDALDECVDTDMREVAEYLRGLVIAAQDRPIAFDVCLSRRDFPHIPLLSALEVNAEHNNARDIETFVRLKLDCLGFHNLIGNSQFDVQRQLIERSRGIFVWASLVIEEIEQYLGEGRSCRFIASKLRVGTLPPQLSDLFQRLLNSRTGISSQAMIGVFQWATLALRPLRVREWQHILPLIEIQAPTSFTQIKESPAYPENDEQTTRRIKAMSRGLVEVRQPIDSRGMSTDTDSVAAGAGSLDSSSGDSRRVQVIHESVREFFLKGTAFECLGGGTCRDFITAGHLQLMTQCLDYLMIRQLDPFVGEATSGDRQTKSALEAALSSFSSYFASKPTRRLSRRSSVASFGSSASSHGSYSDPYTLNPKNEDRKTFSLSFPSLPGSPRPISASESAKSQTMESQTMEADLVLASYARNMALAHAKLAEDSGAPVDEIIGTTEMRTKWERWMALQRDFRGKEGLLCLAAGHGLTSWVRYLLAGHAQEINLSTALLKQALIDAIYGHQPDAAGILLAESGLSQRSATADSGEDEDFSIAILVKERQYDDLRRLLGGMQACFSDREARENVCDLLEGKTPLLQTAVIELDERAFRILIDAGFDVNKRPRRQAGRDEPNTPLETAISEIPLGTYVSHIAEHERIMNTLMDEGADVNASDESGWTPLHTSTLVSDAKLRHATVLKLIARGADPNALTKAGRAPLHEACARNRGDAAKTLISAGADINARDGEGWTALHLALESNHLSPAMILLKGGVDVLPQDCAVALGKGLDTFVSEAISRGCVDCRDGFPTDLLRQCFARLDHGHHAFTLLETLLRHGADSNVVLRNFSGGTPLHACVSSLYARRALVWCRSLIYYGADVSLRDEDGKTASDLAKEKGYVELAGVLHVNTTRSEDAEKP